MSPDDDVEANADADANADVVAEEACYVTTTSIATTRCTRIDLKHKLAAALERDCYVSSVSGLQALNLCNMNTTQHDKRNEAKNIVPLERDDATSEQSIKKGARVLNFVSSLAASSQNSPATRLPYLSASLLALRDELLFANMTIVWYLTCYS